MAPARNPTLDILRAIAVVLVLISHYTVILPHSSAMLETGGVGVDLFFVLSGFLISGLLFGEFKKTGKIDLKRFWIRRGFKIYPPFYALIGITAVIAWVRTRTLPSQLLWEATFLQNYGRPFWPHTWSLAVEEHFYLFLPLVLVLLSRIGAKKQNPFRAIPTISICICALCLCLRMLAFRHAHDWSKVAFPTHLRLDALFAGVTLGYFSHFDEISFREGKKTWVLLLGCFFVLTLLVLPDIPRLTFSYVAFSFVLVWAVNHSKPKSVIWKPVAWIGYYSYSIYLWHVFALLALEIMPSRWYRFPVYIGIAMFFGIGMSKLIEVPSLKLRDQLFPSSSVKNRTEAKAIILNDSPLPKDPILESTL
jgi:peptidoglycan/LPS O-acetylase OafA/YrhL